MQTTFLHKIPQPSFSPLFGQTNYQIQSLKVKQIPRYSPLPRLSRKTWLFSVIVNQYILTCISNNKFPLGTYLETRLGMADSEIARRREGISCGMARLDFSELILSKFEHEPQHIKRESWRSTPTSLLKMDLNY